MITKIKILGILIGIFASHQLLEAKQIGSETQLDWFVQAERFLRMDDPSIQRVIVGCLIMGVSCGLIGSYVVTRRLSLFGDTLSHAILPGIAVGFIWSGTKDNYSIFVGAMIAGFLGVSCLSVLQKFTKINGDSSLGIVLSAFYAFGICLLTRIQKVGYSDQAGLDSFMFGQISSFSTQDLYGQFFALLLIGLFIFFNYRQLLVSGFDFQFSRSIGIPAELLQYGLWILISFCVISSLQMVGVILVSAMLVIPAATASLISKRMNTYLTLASILGAIAGFVGAFLSFLGKNLPTGPLIVLVAGSFFALVLFLQPQKGILFQWLRLRSENSRIAIENTLKAAFQILESRDFQETEISSQEMMRKRGLSSAEVQRETLNLINAGLATKSTLFTEDRQLLPQTNLTLTPKGWEYSCKIVRNHRLWELYLTNEAEYEPDHVHEDAEKIEHVIGEKTVRKLEKLLKNPRTDPHGKLIPSMTDIQQGHFSLKP
ncbi:MAG: metal ABC transporter permease [Verrucomicrobiota bacterium]|nr:metal ABC transporter permease [Verrucomicrobiota bacterium]